MILTSFSRHLVFKMVVVALIFIFSIPVGSIASASGFDSHYVWPVKGKITLRFHSKYWDKIDKKTRTHCGIDISALAGSPVYAASDGIVSFAGFTPAGGMTVSIKHQSGIRTTYLPLTDIIVSRGQKVTKGQRIATLSSSGDKSSSKSHLHMGAIFAGRYIDPEKLLKGLFELDLSQYIRRGNIPPEGYIASDYSHKTLSLLQGAGNDSRHIWELFLQAIISIPEGIDSLADLLKSSLSAVKSFSNNLFREMVKLAASQTRWMLDGLRSFSSRMFAGFSDLFRICFDSLNRGLYSLNLRLFSPFSFFKIPDFSKGLKSSRKVFDPSGDQRHGLSRIFIFLNGNQGGARTVAVYNADGRMVKRLRGWSPPSKGMFWDGSDNSGRIVPEGLYTVIVDSNGGLLGREIEVRYHLR